MMLDRPVALVTGASRGIGRACAVELARSGFDIAVNYLADEAGALETVRLVEQAGGRAVALQCDVSMYDAAKHLVQCSEELLGPIEVLVGNAGITRDALLIRMSEDDWDQVLDTNLKGVYNVTKWAVRSMARRRRGRIVNISSVVALRGNPGQANYAAAKAGIIGFTKSLAKEMARYGITANVVAPGYISTDMTENLPLDVKEAFKRQIPLGRPGTPADVAYAVAFLSSPQAGYITGQVLPVDGGLSSGLIL
ncbi:MAG: 3-oxoacyl-[acyl-carrier-protein] reductase [Bacillota bacterium]|jgi:3-oxoacyl-[acyl-carrier protein] reductase|nr:3-oxoacyl-[acyl-carrier-protein] reductase [Candidatus Fermentithermobacillaceae bacterium]